MPPFEKIPCAIATSVGTALTAAGALAAGTSAPAYVAMEERSAGSGYVNAVRVTDDLIFETDRGRHKVHDIDGRRKNHRDCDLGCCRGHIV